MSNLGKTLAVNILAFIPGPGSIAGGLISGGVAVLLTSSVGEALNISCYKLYEEILKGNKNIKKQVSNFANMVQKYATDNAKSEKKPEDYKTPD